MGIALAAFLIGFCGALIRGFWGVSHDCQSWVSSHCYQLVQNDWWPRRAVVSQKTPGGDELFRSEDIRSKATGWAWPFAIFAIGTLPAAAMIAICQQEPQTVSLGLPQC